MTEADAVPAGNLSASKPLDWVAEVAKHQPWLRMVILARLREPQAVDEVMQEVALAAVEQRAPLVDSTKVAPWLYRLAVIQAFRFLRNAVRRRQKLQRWAKQVGLREVSSEQADPLHLLLNEERWQMVRVAVAKLPGKDSEILLLKYVERWTYQQISEHLGITAKAVDCRLHRARERLRRELERMGVEGEQP